jgi:hypothetical protein
VKIGVTRNGKYLITGILLTPTHPGETTTGNSETSKSVYTSSKEDQDTTREQAEVQPSALSDYSPGILPLPSITTNAKTPSTTTIKTSALDYNGERYLSSIINCVVFRL